MPSSSVHVEDKDSGETENDECEVVENDECEVVESDEYEVVESDECCEETDANDCEVIENPAQPSPALLQENDNASEKRDKAKCHKAKCNKAKGQSITPTSAVESETNQSSEEAENSLQFCSSILVQEDSEATNSADNEEEEEKPKTPSSRLNTKLHQKSASQRRGHLKRSSAKRLQLNITSKLQKYIDVTNTCNDEHVLLELEKGADVLLSSIKAPEVKHSSGATNSSDKKVKSSGVEKKVRVKMCPKLFLKHDEATHSNRVHCDLLLQWYRANANINKLIEDNRVESANAPFIVDVDRNVRGNERSGSNSRTSEEEGDDGDELKILCVRTRLRSRPKQRFSARFTKDVEIELTTNCQLSDETINLAQKILFEQFPRFSGFEDTNLGVTNGFSKHNDTFVQILFADHHWITTSSHNNSRINLFDSNSSGKLNRAFEKQICQLMRCPLNSLEIMLNSVQKQTNAIDCGLFAIAFAVDICFGTSPVNRPYDIEEMRSHLKSCLENEKFSLFPTFSGRVPFSKSRLHVKDVFCICRQSFYADDCEKNSKLFMAKCSCCYEWYHRGCVNIPIKIFKDEKEHEKWTCPG